jgi:hypothetical protein
LTDRTSDALWAREASLRPFEEAVATQLVMDDGPDLLLGPAVFAGSFVGFGESIRSPDERGAEYRADDGSASRRVGGGTGLPAIHFRLEIPPVLVVPAAGGILLGHRVDTQDTWRAR